MKRIGMSGAILAGGASARMGHDKALLGFGAATLLEHLSAVVASVFEEHLVIVNDRSKTERLALCGARVYEDLVKARGPMGGVYTALEYARFDACCVLTCDMPYVDDVFIRQFLGFWEASDDALCAQDRAGKWHPFPGIYRSSVSGMLRSLLDRGQASMHQFLDRVHVKPLALQEERVLYNMNTPADYYFVLRERAGVEP